jgi:hypothetical protein
MGRHFRFFASQLSVQTQCLEMFYPLKDPILPGPPNLGNYAEDASCVTESSNFKLKLCYMTS